MNLENMNEVLQDQTVDQAPVQEQEYEESVEQVDQESSDEAVEQSQETPKSKNQENIRALRERAERAERAEKERDELLKYVLAQQKHESPKTVYQEPEEEDYLKNIGLEEDGLVEGKQLKYILKKQRELEKELSSYKQKATTETIEMKLKSEYPDFDKVISKDNLVQLRRINPDLADIIVSTPDLYKQGSIAYQMIKQYGIHKDPVYSLEKEAMTKNIAKPRSAAGAAPQSSNSPLSRAAMYDGPLTKEQKDAIYRQVIADAARR